MFKKLADTFPKDRYQPGDIRSEPAGLGINLIGHASASIGLGAALRHLAHALIDAGFAVSVFDVAARNGRDGFDTSLKAYTVATLADLPHRLNILVLGATSLPRIFSSPLNELRRPGRLNVAWVWWELPDLPPYLIDTLGTFDVLIASSPFIRESLLRQVPGVPVLLAPHPLTLSDSVSANRARFGLPSEHFIVYTGFDPSSTFERKNPFAAIDAFMRAFPGEPNRSLLVKLNAAPPVDGSAESAELARLRALANQDSRIRIWQERLDESELLSLYASCDAGLSLHRSEGLGLFPLEFMRLGRPVVATAWSGSLAYMTHANACLVRADIRPVSPSWVMHYGRDHLGITSRWAEPEVDHAAAWLRALANDPALHKRISERARADALDYDATARRLDFVDELAALLDAQSYLPPRDTDTLHRAALRSVGIHSRRGENRRKRFERIQWVRALPSRIHRKLRKLARPILG